MAILHTFFHPRINSRVPIERSRQGLSENVRFIAVTQAVLEIFLKNL